MINFWFAIRNPFKAKPFRMIWHREKRLSKNKSGELQLSYYAFNCIEIQLDLNWRQTDHAGPWLMINLFGWQLDIRIYDHRHWNNDNNSWETYEGS